MQTTVLRTKAALQNVYTFCQSPPAPLNTATAPLGPNFTSQVTLLGEALTNLTGFITTLSSGTRSLAIANRQAARKTLREEYLIPIRQIGQALQRTHPGFPKLTVVPRQNAHQDILLSAARATATDIAPYASLFIADGLPTDFLDQLNAAIQAVEQQTVADQSARQQRLAAHQGVKNALYQGRGAVQHLNALIHVAVKQDPANGSQALAAWETIRRTVVGKVKSIPSGTSTTVVTSGSAAGSGTAGNADAAGADVVGAASAGSGASVPAAAGAIPATAVGGTPTTHS